MISLDDSILSFCCTDVHPDAICNINFQSTLRIPDDNREYPLPPGFGCFPIEHVEDHHSRLSENWKAHGGVLLPMHQAEALWIDFDCYSGYPFAIKIATGKINAITGKTWKNELNDSPQDYVVIPEQPWLDGYCVQKDLIRQFVAMPLGQGYSTEEQLTGEAIHGGIQIIAYPMKYDAYEQIRRKKAWMSDIQYDMAPSKEMGLAPGGLMRQKIEKDPHGIDIWDTSNPARCFVHILNSNQWHEVTGKPAPDQAPTAADYTKAGLPWFDYYNEESNALEGSEKLGQLDSVAAKGIKKGEKPLPANEAVSPKHVVALSKKNVKDGCW